MTDIIFHDLQFDQKTRRIAFVPKKVKELHLHNAGEDGQFLWFEMILEDGEKIQSGYYKET
jgi:hypothetical protein